jgi:hypothetical protein
LQRRADLVQSVCSVVGLALFALRLGPTALCLSELDAFAAAIRAGRPPEPGLEDAATALATVLALYRAAELGRVVRIRPAQRPRPPAPPGVGDRHDAR